MSKINLLNSLLLSINRALVSEITSDIRKITYALNDSKIIISCYFEGQITEENEESMDCLEAEVIADFPGHAIDFQFRAINMPESLEQYRLSAWA